MGDPLGIGPKGVPTSVAILLGLELHDVHDLVAAIKIADPWAMPAKAVPNEERDADATEMFQSRVESPSRHGVTAEFDECDAVIVSLAG